MAKIDLPPNEGLYPVPVVLVSCLDKETGKPNIITIAWCGIACSDPALVYVSIRPSRYSHKIISASREFVINIPECGQLGQVDLCGTVSGRDTDKFSASGFTAVASKHISAPTIKECPVNVECVLKDVLRLGTHDMFIAKVAAVHANKELLNEYGRIDFARANPIAFNLGEYWGLGRRIGIYGFSAKKA